MRHLLRMLSASLLALTFLVTSLSSATFALAAPGSSTAESPATEHNSAVTGVEKVADPDTSADWRTFFGISENNPVYSTDKAGRIWVDASVYASNEDAAAAGIAAQMDDPQNDFLVSISAIAQTAAIHEQDGTGRDVVFVVSLNSVLGSTTYAGQPQASYVIEALNNAIGRLMEQNAGNNAPATRVAVIGYSSVVTTLMPLDEYEPDASGAFLAYDSSTKTVSVTATPAQAQTATKSTSLGSGTYLQRAIYEAGKMLVGAGNADAKDRSPEIIVMGAATPPMASTQVDEPPIYTGDTSGFVGPLPGTRESGNGTDALFATMLTMRLAQQSVDAAYANGGSALSVYTTGIDATGAVAYLLDTPAGQVNSDLTAMVGGTEIDLRENLNEAAQAYAAAAANSQVEVALDLYGSSTGGIKAERVTFPVVNGLLDASDPTVLSCVEHYFPARSASAVDWAFASSLDEMFDVRYISPVDADESLAEGSRIEAHSTLGAGMEVERVRGVQYGDTLLTGELAAQAIEMSLKDPGDLSGATHEFDYLVRSINDRYNLGYSAYDLFYEALQDGQVSYDASTGAFSNRASWYIGADHHMVAGDNGAPYRFATQAEISALTAGAGSSDLPDDTSTETAERIEAARKAGATAVCETYFYIGNLPNFYTGGDVALYDFYIAVETDLATGAQTVYASIPSDAVPAFRADVTLDADGSATMALDDVEAVSPVRLVFEVAPREEVRDVLARVQAGGALTEDELTEMLGDAGVENADGDLAVAALAYGGADGADAASQPLVTTALTGNAAPGSAYVVSSDTPLYTLAAGVEVAKGELPQASELVPLTSEPVAGNTYYYLETTYSARFSSASEAAPATATKTVRRYVASESSGTAAWRVGAGGQYELIAGSPAMPTGTIAVVNAKAQNRTGTLPYTQELRGDASGGTLVLTANLGNNGAYVFEVASEEPDPDPDPGTDPEPGGDEEPGGGDGGTTQPDDGEGGDHGDSGNEGDSDSTPEQGGMSNEDGSEGSGSDSNTLTGTDGTRAAKLTITLAIFGSAACLAGIVLMVARKLKR
ncbi:hypothetical protein [uncultured Enorma sp.]|uniref:hypothetical protein n=1 Tax=uncultured Enorma sp. TaxID=1714346 RepID=UPI002616726C|nr:hypothetical protein [uncultured Enorma sp.]